MIGHVRRKERADREAQNDLNTHADQCVVGLDVLIVNDAIQGFDPNQPKIDNLCTVSAPMAYDLPDTVMVE